MAAQKGKDLLIKVDQDGTFITVAGLRAKRLAFNAETVDITDAESSGSLELRWKKEPNRNLLFMASKGRRG